MQICKNKSCSNVSFGENRLPLLNAATRLLLTHSSEQAYITPVVYVLHWLPIVFKIQFKIAALTYGALNDQAPGYMSQLLTKYALLAVFIDRRRIKDQRAQSFSVCGSVCHQLCSAGYLDFFV